MTPRHTVVITPCHFDAAVAAEKSHQLRMDEIPRGVYPALDAGLGMTILSAWMRFLPRCIGVEMTSQPMDY
jgi:hypothetical protein